MHALGQLYARCRQQRESKAQLDQLGGSSRNERQNTKRKLANRRAQKGRVLTTWDCDLPWWRCEEKPPSPSAAEGFRWEGIARDAIVVWECEGGRKMERCVEDSWCWGPGLLIGNGSSLAVDVGQVENVLGRGHGQAGGWEGERGWRRVGKRRCASGFLYVQRSAVLCYCRSATRRAVWGVASLHGNGDTANGSCPHVRCAVPRVP